MVKNPPAKAEDTSDTGLIPGLGRSPGEGNGNPLQYSCLENLTDRGAWQAMVHRVSRVRCDWSGLACRRPLTSLHGVVTFSLWLYCPSPLSCPISCSDEFSLLVNSAYAFTILLRLHLFYHFLFALCKDYLSIIFLRESLLEKNNMVFSSVQLLSCVQHFATPWTAARQASLSITSSQSLFKLMSI